MSSLRAILPNDRYNRLVLALFLALWAASCVRLPYPKYFALQHVPTVIAVVVLVVVEQRIGIDRFSFTLMILFLLLHVLGARYLYSYVPYDDWSQKLLGVRITDHFGFERNHYDRLVHFCFGLLFVPPLWRLSEDHLGLRGYWPATFAICAILAASAAYEIIEWGMAMIFAPDWAEAYNGQQGDVWDAQRDMTLAAAGALAGVSIMGLIRRRADRNQ